MSPRSIIFSISVSGIRTARRPIFTRAIFRALAHMRTVTTFKPRRSAACSSVKSFASMLGESSATDACLTIFRWSVRLTI